MRDLVSPDLDLIKQAEQEARWFLYEKGDCTPPPSSAASPNPVPRCGKQSREERCDSRRTTRTPAPGAELATRASLMALWEVNPTAI
jgi:hypothetical protein